MTSSARPTARTSATPSARRTKRSEAPASSPGQLLPASPVSQLELVGLLHKSAVIEIVMVEVEPSRYQVHLVVVWHYGRSVLTGTSGQPRSFRSLDTLRTHLKTLGVGNTLIRLELLP